MRLACGRRATVRVYLYTYIRVELPHVGKNNGHHINKTHCDNSECNSISQNEQPPPGGQVSLLI